MDTQTRRDRAGWAYAAKFVALPSIIATAGVWRLTHDYPMTYVTFMTTWLFAIVGAAFQSSASAE